MYVYILIKNVCHKRKSWIKNDYTENDKCWKWSLEIMINSWKIN